MDRADIGFVEPGTHAMVVEHTTASTKAENTRCWAAAGGSALNTYADGMQGWIDIFGIFFWSGREESSNGSRARAGALERRR